MYHYHRYFQNICRYCQWYYSYLTDNNNNNDSDSDKKGVPAFLVGTDGKLLSVKYKKQSYLSVKGFFNDNVDPKNVPINYSSSGKTLHENFHNFIQATQSVLWSLEG